MSVLIFHAKGQDVRVRGAERFHLVILVADTLFAEALVRPKLRQALQITDTEWDKDKVTGMILSGRLISVDGRSIEITPLALNTVMAGSSDTLRLAARLDAQCEIHSYVEGPNRAWLAQLIDAACEDGTFRREMGWDQVTALLRSSDDGPVVTSYTMTDGFPDLPIVQEYGDWRPNLPSGMTPAEYEEAYEEAWGEEPNQWEIAMDALRKSSKQRGLELKPDGFADFRFGDGVSAYDL